MADDGRLWVGTTPDPGAGLPTGSYQIAILRGTQKLFVYEFRVLPSKMLPDVKAICVPVVS